MTADDDPPALAITADNALASIDGLSPVERINLGLAIVADGLHAARRAKERLDDEREGLRQGMVHGEARLRSLSRGAVAVRRDRHRMPVDRMPADARGAIVVQSPVDAVTQRSLELMALTPSPRLSAPPQRPQSWLERLISPEPTRAERLAHG